MDFQAARFVADVNEDLADVFGNPVQRVTRFAAVAFEGGVPTEGEVERRVAAIRAHHEKLYRRAAAETRALWTRANAYVQEAAPWSALRRNRPQAASVTRAALGLIEVCATVAWSIVPNLAASAIAAVGGTEAGGVPA